MNEFPQLDSGLAVLVFNQGDDPIACLNKTEDLDTYDFDCGDVYDAMAILMANLSNYDSDFISEVPRFETFHTDMDNQSFYDDTHKQALGYQNPFYLKKARRIKPTFYDGSVLSSEHAASHVIEDEKILILVEVSRSKRLAKQNDPMSNEKKVNTTPINYVELSRLLEDFGKEIIDNAAQIPIATTIALDMFKLDLNPLAPRLLQNRDAHIYYLKHTREQAEILWGIVKQVKVKQLL
nr:hypothetical protein [Tanacetum cinerariifolium]